MAVTEGKYYGRFRHPLLRTQGNQYSLLSIIIILRPLILYTPNPCSPLYFIKTKLARIVHISAVSEVETKMLINPEIKQTVQFLGNTFTEHLFGM